MKYKNIEPAIFLERPNRFIAYVEQAGRREICHVKNTGRCKELLIPGAFVYVQRQSNPARKTALDLIAVKKGEKLINMDSQIPNKIAEEWLRKGNLCSQSARIRPECKYGNSRFDFYIEDGERKAFIEIKGVTLEEDGVARFPDAPTERGVKHIRELMACRQEGYEAFILFVIQMKGVSIMEPNDITHAAFGDALRKAKEAGVHILAYDCKVCPDEIEIDERVEVHL
ncbi:MAG: DNA/RNA nuclease SfsA [Lachnospiraceae bacterium]|jgi:sugar fermentation stimulation protein A|nr:DNA/RNA nuclease SfsA [Lachnospiraceae bacterium]